MRFTLIILSLSLLTGLCNAAPQKPKADEPWSNAGTNSSVRQPRQVVMRDAAAFDALWKEHVKNNAAKPAIDFKRYDLVAVFAGTKSTGGYSVEFGKPVIKGKEATIPVAIYKPAPGAMVTQAFTYPYAMKAFAKLPAKVTVKVEDKVKQP